MHISDGIITDAMIVMAWRQTSISSNFDENQKRLFKLLFTNVVRYERLFYLCNVKKQ